MSALMSSMKLAAFPIIAMVLFLAAFAVILGRVMFSKSGAELERAGRIPIDDGVVTPRPAHGQTSTGESRRNF